MDRLKPSPNIVSLEIIGDDDEVRGIFRFDPTDPTVANRALQMQKNLVKKEKEMQDEIKKISDDDIGAKLQMICDIIAYFRAEIDNIFGAGTSQIVFGNASNMDMFAVFFIGIAPYYQKAAQQRMSKHTSKYRK